MPAGQQLFDAYHHGKIRLRLTPALVCKDLYYRTVTTGNGGRVAKLQPKEVEL
jgi:hypothetical protein